METTVRTHRHLQLSRRNRESGLTLIEVLFSIIIFFTGVAGVLGLLVHSVAMAKFNDDELLAKQKLREAMESVYGARNSKALGFASVNNIGTSDTSTGVTVPGIFLVDWQPLYASGPDGIVGTADDVSAGVEEIKGPDGRPRRLTEFQRRIVITSYVDSEGNAAGNLKRIQVSVRFDTGTFGMRTYTMNALISQFR